MEKSKIKKQQKLLPVFKSGTIPPAQSSAQCESSYNVEAQSNIVMKAIEPNSKLSVSEKAIIELMYLSGCRISEALNVKSSDILSGGRIKVGGSKKSNPVIVSTVLYRDYWIKNKLFIPSLHSIFSRFYFYRLFNKIGLYIIFKTSNKKAVTHSLRHLYIKQLHESNIDSELIKTTIGHKKVTSQKHYYKK